MGARLMNISSETHRELGHRMNVQHACTAAALRLLKRPRRPGRQQGDNRATVMTPKVSALRQVRARGQFIGFLQGAP